MEPRREEKQKAPPPDAGPKPKRFRIVKLEDRIAPKQGGGNFSHGQATGCGPTCPTNNTWYCPSVGNCSQ
jgi:hypothetical protein